MVNELEMTFMESWICFVSIIHVRHNTWGDHSQIPRHQVVPINVQFYKTLDSIAQATKLINLKGFIDELGYN